MPKSRKRKKKAADAGGTGKVSWHAPTTAGTRRINIAVAVLAVAAIVAGGIYWFPNLGAERDFLALAAEGRDRLGAVETKANLGRRHLAVGETYAYRDSIPTSGPHDLTWVGPGFYETTQTPTRVVHALEHGNIVIYYDQPDEAVLETLKEWTALYTGQWDGVVAAPMPGLGAGLMLTAWTKQLRMARFDAALAAAFIDAYRGRGPEHPVR